jgi:hypothetical protein
MACQALSRCAFSLSIPLKPLFATAAGRPTTRTIPRPSWPLCALRKQSVALHKSCSSSGLSYTPNAYWSTWWPTPVIPPRSPSPRTRTMRNPRTRSKIATDVPGRPFDNTLVDMSHYEKEENQARAKTLTEYRHTRGVATEADPGHMEDGEDGVQDMEGSEGALTMPEKNAKLIEELAEESMDVVGSYGKT